MAIKSKIIAILIVTITLTGCEPMPVFEDPDEPVTKREFYEYRQQQSVGDGILLVLTLYLVVVGIALASISGEIAVDQHKIDDHGFTQS